MIDLFIREFDKGLRTVFAPSHSVRPYPGLNTADPPLAEKERRHAAALMRINHSGEVCAQALYNGQALTARNPATAAALRQASQEETEHLAWCEKRIRELGGRKSLLNPLWYAGAFSLGAVAGALGDKWNLGFLAETETQVGRHLDRHLAWLPADDFKSRAVLAQMKEDELKHATTALHHGGAELPAPVKLAMKLASKIFTTVTYRV
ncbi:MAG: 2-polyprenyl-3-methyl-6-methoxy-1,4-benzoquinone monooxygenase [Methylophilaceae bacterium]|nr:2-polyprenyl-3-methyl-6-methoxy-1,4-benzoquinone monooxygenase [Methylophilaceae bacterium]